MRDQSIYNEVGRFGSYGTARKEAKEHAGDLEPGTKHYIFKDITNGPFTSFRPDAYVLLVGPNKIVYDDISEDVDPDDSDDIEETEEN